MTKQEKEEKVRSHIRRIMSEEEPIMRRIANENTVDYYNLSKFLNGRSKIFSEKTLDRIMDNYGI